MISWSLESHGCSRDLMTTGFVSGLSFPSLNHSNVLIRVACGILGL